MALLILSTIFLSIFTFFGFIIYSRYQHFKLRAKIGLKGPETHWFLGNLKQIIDRKQKLGYDDSNEQFIEYHKTYGDIFGTYFGAQLTLSLSNEEDIKEVYIKNFSNFSDRVTPPIFADNNLKTSLLQNSYSGGWKNSRSAIGPIFATGKMKAMHETIETKIATFLEILEEKSRSGKKFDIYDDFQGLTLDVIGKCAFAIDSNCQRDRNDVFYVQARKFFANLDIRHSKAISASFILPELGPFWRYLYKFTEMAAAELPLVGGLSDVYERRRGGEGSESVDLLKLLLDREDDKEKSKMTKTEVIENCFAFLLAGYETTSTAMTYCTYLLAKYPKVQQKLLEEIETTKMEKGGLNYDSIHNMKYLDAVYKESLRFYPPVIHFMTRTCLNDITIRGQFYPKDTVVTVIPYVVHRNESNWGPTANEFDPDRFLDWNDKGSLKWIPFGVGPRYCVGMRFAEMEFKTTIAKLVEKFELKIDATEPELVPDCNGVIMRPKDPVRLILEERK